MVCLFHRMWKLNTKKDLTDRVLAKNLISNHRSNCILLLLSFILINQESEWVVDSNLSHAEFAPLAGTWCHKDFFPASFSLFSTFQYSWQKHKVCRRLDSNGGPLVSEATALPTEPQPLPYFAFFLKLCALKLKYIY